MEHFQNNAKKKPLCFVVRAAAFSSSRPPIPLPLLVDSKPEQGKERLNLFFWIYGVSSDTLAPLLILSAWCHVVCLVSRGVNTLVGMPDASMAHGILRLFLMVGSFELSCRYPTLVWVFVPPTDNIWTFSWPSGRNIHCAQTPRVLMPARPSCKLRNRYFTL